MGQFVAVTSAARVWVFGCALLWGSALLLPAPGSAQEAAAPLTATPPIAAPAVPPPMQVAPAPAVTASPAPAVPPTPAAPQPNVSASGSIAPSQLPRDLSPWNMFLSADIVVKGVMIGLALASVLTWTAWLTKSLELIKSTRSLRRALIAVSAQSSLRESQASLGKRPGVMPALLEAAMLELRRSADVHDKQSINERIGSRLERIEAAAGRDMVWGTGLLATIGATAPFVGLFGTVWGIMNSFISISKAQTTNLAVVAPGIAEALLATALGLVTAIPAVIFYNRLARSIANYKALVADSSAEVARQVSRDLDRRSALDIHAARAAE
jgi:biopolymer transport protein ExbB